MVNTECNKTFQISIMPWRRLLFYDSVDVLWGVCDYVQWFTTKAPFMKRDRWATFLLEWNGVLAILENGVLHTLFWLPNHFLSRKFHKRKGSFFLIVAWCHYLIMYSCLYFGFPKNWTVTVNMKRSDSLLRNCWATVCSPYGRISWKSVMKII